jgi:hypothetical protein
MQLPGPFKIVNAAVMRPILDAHFAQLLAGDGFVRVNEHKWIRRRTPHFADLFVLQAMKAGSYSPVWGFAIDFVPHISGGRLRSHNTDKAAMFDYRYDPLDVDYDSRAQNEGWFINRLLGLTVADRDAQRVALLALPMALSLFARVTQIEDISDLFRSSLQAHRAGPPYRFGFFNYTQFPIAFACILAKQGRYGEGVAVLQEAVQLGTDYGAVYANLLARMRHLSEVQSASPD